MAENYKHPEHRKNVLYIYGYGGSRMSRSVEKLKSILPEDQFKVMCWDYPQQECMAAISFLEQKIKSHHIDIVVGSSLGAFVAMCLKVKCRKIIINPCLIPSVELPKLQPLPGKPVPSLSLISSYAPYEATIFDNLPEGSHCFMAEHDELFGNTYRPQMEANMPVTTIPGGHRLSDEALPIIKDVLMPKVEAKKAIVFLTGAGISAESGIPTFRDSNGLWNNHNVEDVASIEGWERNPELVLNFYNQRRADLMKVQPNDAHLAITKLQEKYNVVVITQNVDDLHERAGTDMVFHLHGELKKVCSSANKEKCVHELPLDVPIRMGDKAEDGSQLRPYIVWFGEDVTNIQDACNIVQHADIFVVVGTSLEVNPAASLVIYSRAEQNYVIDPAAPKDMLEELDPTLHVINLPATEGMKMLLEELGME